MFTKLEVRPITIAETSQITPFDSYLEAKEYAKKNMEQLAFGLSGLTNNGTWEYIAVRVEFMDMLYLIDNLFGIKLSSGQGRFVFARGDTSSVPVKHWDCYHSEHETTHTHQFDLADQRASGGQVFVDIGALKGSLDDILSVTMEINTNPLNGLNHVPCAHIHFDGDNVAVSLFKIGDGILVRPEVNVTIEAFQQKTGPNLPPETMYWIK